MGMSASQARLLYITAQLNNLSLQGQNVSDAKIRLSMDSERIQENIQEHFQTPVYILILTYLQLTVLLLKVNL